MQFAPIWSTRFVAEELCAFLHSEDPNDGPNVSAPQDLMMLLQERYRSFHFLSKPEVQHGLLNTFPEHRPLVQTQRTELLIKCFVRDNVVLIFHPLDHWPESSNQTPRGLPEPLGESRRFSLERWRFPNTFAVEQTLSFTRSWVRIGNRCLYCLSNSSRNLRQSWRASLSELLIFSCQPRDLLIQSMLLSLQRIHHLHKFFNCRHLALYRWSRELQPSRFVSLQCPQRVPVCHQRPNTEHY